MGKAGLILHFQGHKRAGGGQGAYGSKPFDIQSICLMIEIPTRKLRWIKNHILKFSFFSEKEIKEAHGQVKGREYILMLTNSWYPGPKFLEKYRIKVGKSFECYLKVIIRGTCTLVLFYFPTIDLSDYFEC